MDESDSYIENEGGEMYVLWKEEALVTERVISKSFTNQLSESLLPWSDLH